MWTVAEIALITMLVALAVMSLVVAGVLIRDAALGTWDALQERRAARTAEREAALRKRPRRDLRDRRGG